MGGLDFQCSTHFITDSLIEVKVIRLKDTRFAMLTCRNNKKSIRAARRRLMKNFLVG